MTAARTIVPKEAGSLLGVSAKTILRWCASGDVPGAFRIGPRGHWRIDRETFEAAISAAAADHQSPDRDAEERVDSSDPAAPDPPEDTSWTTTPAGGTVTMVLEPIRNAQWREVPEDVRLRQILRRTLRDFGYRCRSVVSTKDAA